MYYCKYNGQLRLHTTVHCFYLNLSKLNIHLTKLIIKEMIKINIATHKENTANFLFLLHCNNPCVNIRTPNNGTKIFIAFSHILNNCKDANIITLTEQMLPTIKDIFSYICIPHQALLIFPIYSLLKFCCFM